MGAPPQPPFPEQVPRYDLPGSEWFALAPNAKIAIQGRRRIIFQPPVVAVPASTDDVNISGFQLLETNFTATSGVYVHAFWAIASLDSPGITINSIFAGLSLRTTPNPDYPLGSPTLTTPTLNLNSVVLTDRDRLVASKDIIVVPNLGIPLGTNLTLSVFMNVNNTSVVVSHVTVATAIIYTRLDGLTE